MEVLDSTAEVEVHQILDTQTVLTTVEGVDWAIPLTITPSTVEESENEILIDSLPEDSECFTVKECDSEYIFVEADETIGSDEPNERYYVINDGTINCVDEVLFETEECYLGGITLKLDSEGKPKKPKTHFCKVPGCGRGYSTPQHLKVHERNHSGERPFKCPSEGCDKEFNRDYSLKAHLRIHTGERPYDCTYKNCGKAFKTSGDLHKHMRIHTGERPFICPIKGCRKAFTTSNTCKIHTRTHTGEKPYVCPEEGCEKEFSSSTNFKNHMRIHSGERPYSCSVAGCEKRFTEYSSLYKHRLTHSVSKQYQCGYCDKAYRQMTTLTTHKRAVHGVIKSDEGELLLDVEQMIEGETVDNGLESVSCKLSHHKEETATNSFTDHPKESSSLYVYESLRM